MFKLYTNIAGALVILGIILFIASFFTPITIWWGIEISKCGGAIFFVGLFLQLVEKDSKQKQRSIAS